jgi:DNA helicase HerA-like ATPase
MRLTNPADQMYVRRLLPDTLGNLTERLPSLDAGEALLIGDSVVMPSIVQIALSEPTPMSNDVPYQTIWSKPWMELDIGDIAEDWNEADQ